MAERTGFEPVMKPDRQSGAINLYANAPIIFGGETGIRTLVPGFAGLLLSRKAPWTARPSLRVLLAPPEGIKPPASRVVTAYSIH